MLFTLKSNAQSCGFRTSNFPTEEIFSSKKTRSCSMTITEYPTNNLLPRGTQVSLGAVVMSASNCWHKITSTQFEVEGTASCAYMTNVKEMKNNLTQVGSTIPVMSYIHTFGNLNEQILANTSDTFYVVGDLSALALLDTIRTYKLRFIMTATDSLGNVTKDTLWTSEKIIIDGPTGLAIVDKKNISLYPNPANDFIIVEGFSGEIEITDIAGRPFIRKIVSDKEKIDVSNFAKGIYFLRSNNQVVKFTKQ